MSITFTILILINIFFVWLLIEVVKNVITSQMIETKNAFDIANGHNYTNDNPMLDRLQSLVFLF